MQPLEAAARAWYDKAGVEVTWTARSLRDFGDRPLEELAGSFDLLSVDHPFVGRASETGCLAPLDELLSAETLQALAEDAVGPSHSSYAYAGRQWALATDAACQVSAIRGDLMNRAPATWDDVLELARSEPGRVALPLAPADAICSYVTMLASAGGPPPLSEETFAPPELGAGALSRLSTLVADGHPDCLELNPPLLLERMTARDEIAYAPLTFGYTNYSRPGESPHPVRFGDIPWAGRGAVGSILGGAGLAVSAACQRKEDAAAFAAWASGADAQRDIVARFGGQPGSRSAWLDPEVDRITGGFTSGTLSTIEHAYVRPRDPWWPTFQLSAGIALHSLLARRADPEEAYDEVERLYREGRAIS